eukprot:6498818-Lingulodinium_polyedra.AAC.1
MSRSFARLKRAPVSWRGRAICEPLRRRMVNVIASLRGVCKTLRNGAGESANRRHSGSLIARSR